MVAIAGDDAGIILDAESVGINTTDTASGADLAYISTSRTDTGSGTETSSLSALVDQTDSVSGAESHSILQLGSNKSDVDTSQALETFTITATLGLQSDSSSSVQSEAITVPKSSSDTVVSTEFISIADVSDWSSEASGTTLRVSAGQFLVLGPATVYIGNYGALEPTDHNIIGTPDPLEWVDLGSTLDGVSVLFKQEYESPDLMQIPDKTMSRIKKRDVQAKATLAEPLLDNFMFLLNEGVIDNGIDYRSFTPLAEIDEAVPPTYRAVILDGWAPDVNSSGRHKRRRIIMRKCLSLEGTTTSYTKDKQTTQEITWSAHYIDSATAAVKVIDEV